MIFMNENLPLGIYVHYPFCVRKCPYCDFVSYSKAQCGIADEDYLFALLNEFKIKEPFVKGRTFRSIYFGGGTPSLFKPSCIGTLLETLSSYIDTGTEISMEANPGTVTKKLLKAYHDAGINRLSLGVQSFTDRALKALGRIHDSKSSFSACESAQSIFDNFNIDLMHGLPGQSINEALYDLQCALDFSCTHLSWYELTIEEDTAFGTNPPALPDEDLLIATENEGFSFLNSNDYQRYEISAFHHGKPCQHNTNYWSFGDYLGLGAAAHSKLKIGSVTYRQSNYEDVPQYLKDVYLLKESGDVRLQVVADSDLPFEFMLNRLRLLKETGIEEFSKTTGLDFNKVKPQLLKAQQLGLLYLNDTGYGLTEHGKWHLNEILKMFLDS